MKKILLTILTTSIMASAAFAGTVMVSSDKNPKEPVPVECDLYRANEFSIDLFGTYNVTSESTERLFGDHAFGGGLAVNYFFTKNIGIGVEGQVWGTRSHETEGSAALNLTFRFPIGCTGWAPYFYVGGGAVSNPNYRDNDGEFVHRGEDFLAEGHVGGGISYRFTRSFGVFTDARYTYVDRPENNFIGVRTGITFAF